MSPRNRTPSFSSRPTVVPGTESRRRREPRIERTQQAVRHAALEVLGRRGYAAFTIEAVAEAARVGKTTIYRQWPTKLALIADAR